MLLEGLEPTTYSLEGCRSIQLSYRGILCNAFLFIWFLWNYVSRFCNISTKDSNFFFVVTSLDPVVAQVFLPSFFINKGCLSITN